MIRKSFDKEWNESKSTPEEKEARLEKEKNAIIGKPAEAAYFKDKIRDFLRILGIMYQSLFYKLIKDRTVYHGCESSEGKELLS